MKERLNWLVLAGDFARKGDYRGMRACARELFALDDHSADGPALMAEAAFYAGNFDEAEVLAGDALELEPDNLRARMVLAFLAGNKFELNKQIELLRGIVLDGKKEMAQIARRQKELRVRLHMGREIPIGEKEQHENVNAREKIFCRLMRKVQGVLADALYLAADPEGAAAAIKAACDFADPDEKADLYSKYLFMLNYRSQPPAVNKQTAKVYGTLNEITPYAHKDVKRTPAKRLRIGYISPDFRLHSVAYFLAPLLRDFDQKNFAVYCYSVGREDAVTKRFRRFPVKWRDVRARSPRTTARFIAEDRIDILVDLSGHSQNNCLEIMAYRPAPVQVTGLGYMNTVGLDTIDYFLADMVTSPEEMPPGFAEKPMRLAKCHLCYDPGAVRAMPAPSLKAPSLEKGYVTFGSFNNFAKVSDELLCLWRAVMDRVRNSRLLIKGKICSIVDGREILRQRLTKLSFDLSRVDFSPYSPDYLEKYSRVDIALDTFPYTGGLTTCEALYMGVPVVTLRGRSPGARFGASILDAADLGELIAESQMEYVQKIIHLAGNPDFLLRYHRDLRKHLQKSRLMDAKAYMRDLEQQYRLIWQNFCRS